MNITTKVKRGLTQTWCKHTGNVYGGPGRLNVRAGKRILRKKLKAYLNKMQKDYE